MRPQLAKIFAFVLVILLAGAAAYSLYSRTRGSSTRNEGAPVAQGDVPFVKEKDMEAISLFISAHWSGEGHAAPDVLKHASEGVYVAARAGGKRQADTWGQGKSVGEALARAIEELRRELRESNASTDTLEIFMVTASEAVTSDRRLFSNIRRGVQGLEIINGDEHSLHSPTYALASNRKNERLLKLFKQKRRLLPEQLAALRFRFLKGPQILVSLGGSGRAKASAVLMERGNSYQPLEGVTQSAVEDFAKRMATWMTKNLHEDGRMTYLFWPSQNREAPGKDNLIRQFMATIALGRIAGDLPADEAAQAYEGSARNIDFNLKKYYRRAGEFGFVELRSKAKLGATALAALAIVEHPSREKWQLEEEALLRTVQSLWREDGSFRSFYKPATRNDNQNFYPGEALLLWATLYSQSRDPALLAQFMKSFHYYRAWHLDTSVPRRRNPAFTPWHTQAYYMVWTHTKNEELRDFIFEMNDWLVPLQEWDDLRYRDTRGRFYAPDRPFFGPPHASSTGVYVEGMVDAYRLARSIGDEARMLRYATTIRRALRSSMQLQYVDDVDMYYVQDRDRVFGGLRTTVYNNQIRCDNVQHTWMGVQKILKAKLLPAP